MCFISNPFKDLNRIVLRFSLIKFNVLRFASKAAFIKLGVVFVLILTTLSFGLAQSNQIIKEKLSEENCSPVQLGLRFCNPNTELSFKLNENIFFNLTLENITDQNISLYDIRVRYNEDAFTARQPHIFIVTNSRGERVLTKMEELAQNVHLGKVPIEELITALPVYSNPGRTLINGRETANIGITLNQYFDFKRKDVYSVTISRKIPKSDGTGYVELYLKPFEFEIR